MRVRLTHAGAHARSTVLARRRHLISEALDQTVLPAEAVQGLRVVAERFERMGREIPAQGTGSTSGPERGTMNETDTQINQTGTPLSEAGTPIAETPPRTTETETHETIRTGSFATGEERTPEQDAQDRQHRGSFAAGEEETPEKDAELRVHARGSFAAGEELTPEKDAEERVHPGTFADTEPQEEPTA